MGPRYESAIVCKLSAAPPFAWPWYRQTRVAAPGSRLAVPGAAIRSIMTSLPIGRTMFVASGRAVGAEDVLGLQAAKTAAPAPKPSRRRNSRRESEWTLFIAISPGINTESGGTCPPLLIIPNKIYGLGCASVGLPFRLPWQPPAPPHPFIIPPAPYCPPIIPPLPILSSIHS